MNNPDTLDNAGLLVQKLSENKYNITLTEFRRRYQLSRQELRSNSGEGRLKVWRPPTVIIALRF